MVTAGAVTLLLGQDFRQPLGLLDGRSEPGPRTEVGLAGGALGRRHMRLDMQRRQNACDVAVLRLIRRVSVGFAAL